MTAPFCTACGATAAAGTRFCVKCGQPFGQSSPTGSLPPPPPMMRPPPPPPAIAQPVKQGSGAGVWLAIIGILLLVGGAGVWFYTTRLPGLRATSTIQVAAAEPTPPTAEPSPQPPAQPTSQPSPQPSLPPSDPTPVSSAPVAPARPVVIPPNPDFKRHDPPPQQPTPIQSKPQLVETRPTPPTRSKPASPTSGVLHASVEVAQNGEVVFENLPGARLKFTFDRNLWRPTISHQLNGTQTLVMRSLKPGIQRTCDVRWEIVQ